MPRIYVVVCFASLVAANAIAQDEIAKSLLAINAVGNAGVRHEQAIEAWKAVSRLPADQLPKILKSIDDRKPLAANWIRAAVDQIAERSFQNGRELPKVEMEKAIFDATYSPRARRLAYEWLVRVDDSAEQRIIPEMLNDTSLEMRRDAVAKVLATADAIENNDSLKIKHYSKALAAARDPDQIDKAFDQLVELGEKVDLPRHFGFITSWQLIGPFDNTGKAGFQVPYPPEEQVSFDKTYKGKKGEVKWIAHTTKDKYGMVDLNEALGKNMGAAAYALVEFSSPSERIVDLRLGSICAAKLWLNGDQLMEHEVYHSGTKIDQYVAKGKLNAGKNQILLKICQNEQTDNWAQDWQFQFRVCDEVGTAIHSK